MNRLIATLALIATMAASASAQEGLNMPYSQFGLGTSDMPYNLPTATRTGGVVLTRSGDNFINPFNPASYASIGMESFVFDMGANIQFTTLANNGTSARDIDGNIGYLIVGLPVTRWMKVAGGLMPYTSTDYQSTYTASDPSYGTVKNIYGGTGGTSLVFLGAAFNILNNPEGHRLQAGFNVGYLTGRIQRAISYSFQGTDTTHFMHSRRLRETSAGNFLFDLGLQYWHPLGERYTLGVGLTYKPARNMSVDDKALIYTYRPSDQSPIDTVFPLAGDSPEFTSTAKQDHTFGIGLSLERNKKWLVAADASFAGWSGLAYEEGGTTPIFGTDALRTGPWSRYALGFEKIGTMDASTYWGRISWSAGLHTEQGAMRLFLDGQEQVVNEWGFGLGAALPMRKGRSLLTISLGYSSLGNKDLLQRDCFTVGIAISSCERWFVKRKYN